MIDIWANNYQKYAYKFAVYSNMEYPFLALAEEAGEVMGKLAKYVRKNQKPVGIALMEAKHPREGVSEALREDLKSELGDCIWQLAACATELGMDLAEIMKDNLDKLEGRLASGTIIGEGDHRG